MPASNVTVSAVCVQKYTVTWKNADGTVLETDNNISYGATPTYNGATPTKASDGKYSYTFKEWTPAISSVTGDVTYTAAYTKTPNPAHFSQSGDTYTIHDAAGWDIFCDFIEGGETFSGKTVVLGDDISVTRMAGDQTHSFGGTFDGQGNTLTFSSTAANNYVAPFANLNGTQSAPASISNLNVKTTITGEDFRHIAGLVAVHTGYVDITSCNADVSLSSLVGTDNPSGLYPTGLVSQSNGNLTVSGCTVKGDISTNGKYAAGYVGVVQGSVTIVNSVSSVTINSSTNDDGTHSGFIAAQQNRGTMTIRGCLFNGKLLTDNGTIKCAGFIGWRNSTANIYDSIFDPAEVTIGNEGSATFARNKVDTYNCYYTYLLNDGTNYAPYLDDGTVTPKKYNNGQQGYTITAGDNVTLALNGTATEYDVSGITAYANNSGLKYGDTIYAGNGDSVSLTLDHTTPTGYSTAFTASEGTLENGVLTMPDSDVVISANDTINKYNITLPEKMEITNGVTLTDGKADYGTQIKFKVKDGYTASNVKANGTELTAEDGVYTVTIPDDDVTVTADITFADNVGARLEGYSLSIQEDGDIGVNFYMSLDNDIASDPNAKMLFVIPINSKNNETKTVVMDIPDPTELGGKNYYVFKCPVAAKEMTATITAQVYVGDEAKGDTYTYTVRDYAEYLINHVDDNAEYAKAASLVKAMLHYGASAQTLFNNNTNELANKNVEYTGGLDADGVKAAVKSVIDDGSLTNLDTTPVADGLSFYGASLNLGSKTAYTIYYEKGTDYSSETPPAISCEKEGITVSVKERTVDGKAMVLYVISGISAGNLLDSIDITIGDTSLKVNTATFMYAVLNSTDAQYNNLKNTVVALYNFNKEATTYTGTEGN